MKRTKKKIGLLFFNAQSENLNNYVFKRFKEEAAKNNYELQPLPYYLFSIFYKQNELLIYFNNKKFKPTEYEYIIARYNITGRYNLYDSFSIARYLELTGLKIYNSPQAALLAKNKRDSLLKLAMHKLPVIPTGVNYSTFYLDNHLKRNLNKKFVVKANSGSLGYQVTLLESPISFISFMEFVGGTMEPANLLVQPYINSNSQDYRLIVVGRRVIAAMRRQGQGIEFRSNISKGGRGIKIKPTQKMTRLAVKAVKILGLDYAGVDIIKQKNKLMIVEVNANPGLKIEGVTNVNVVSKIIKYCIRKPLSP